MRLIRFFLLQLAKFNINVFPRLESISKYAQGYGYEPGEKVEVTLALSFVDHRKKLTVFDVGANVGDWTAALLDSSPGSRVYAFEPSPRVKSQLESRFSSFENVQIHEIGFSNQEGIAKLFSNDLKGKMSSLVKRDLDYLGINFDEILDVNLRKLGNWCEERNIVPDILKIDVEGFELQVLQGGSFLSGLK